MSTQNLIIYKLKPLYNILEELSLELNFKIIFFDNESSLSNEVKKFDHYLIVLDKQYLNIDNQFVLENTPINVFQLLEKINIEFMKIQFNSQSELIIKNYTIDLNSRNLSKKNIKLSLTEKEINTIIYLSKLKKPAKVDELQKKVWGYQSNMETHTVETHIYRLRKKFLKNFNDNNFIKHDTEGYYLG